MSLRRFLEQLLIILILLSAMAPWNWKEANSRQTLDEYLALPPPGADDDRGGLAPHEVLDTTSRQLAKVGQSPRQHLATENQPAKQQVAAVPPHWAGPPIQVSQTIHNVVGPGPPEVERSSGVYFPSGGSGKESVPQTPAEVTPCLLYTSPSPRDRG